MKLKFIFNLFIVNHLSHFHTKKWSAKFKHYTTMVNVLKLALKALLLLLALFLASLFSKANSEPSQTSKIELFAKIVNGWIAKSPISDIYPDTEQACCFTIRSHFQHHTNSLIINSKTFKWLTFRLRTKWLWVRIPLQPVKLQIWRLLRTRSSLTFRQTIEWWF